MPLRATDQSFWRHSAADPCWAGQESGGFDWDLRPVAAAMTETLKFKDNDGETKDGFFALKLMPAGGSRKPKRDESPQKGQTRPCRIPAFRRRSGCIPAEPYPPLKRRHIKAPQGPAQAPATHTAGMILEYPPQRHVRKKLDSQAPGRAAKREPPST